MMFSNVFYIKCLLLLFAVQVSMNDLTIENIELDENIVKDEIDKVTDKILIPTVTQFLPNSNDKCLEDGLNRYCTESENYPTDYIRSKLLTDLKKYSKLFTPKIQKVSNTSPTLSITPIHHQDSDFDTRIPYSGTSYYHNRRHYQEKSIVESLCLNKRTVKYLKLAKNRNDDLKYIVNQDNFTQAVEIEECIDAGNSCQMTDSFPLGYRTECKQHYSLRVLLTVNSDGEMIPDLFPLPSCCKCVLHREF